MIEPDKIAPGKIVSISYLVSDQHDNIVEYSDLPVTYPHGGDHQLLPKLEAALEGKSVGDQINVAIKCDDAFGAHDPGLAFTDDIDNAPLELRHIGAEMDAQNADGDVLHFQVTHIGEGRITIDANHPLAGLDLVFTVTVTEVRDSSAAELQQQFTTH